MTSLGAQGIFDYERPRHLFCMLIELPILFVLFLWNFVDTIAVHWLCNFATFLIDRLIAVSRVTSTDIDMYCMNFTDVICILLVTLYNSFETELSDTLCDRRQQDYLASRNGLVWREMIFDFIVVVVIGFFLFNYMRRGSGYAGSYLNNATGVATTALIEFVVQVCACVNV